MLTPTASDCTVLDVRGRGAARPGGAGSRRTRARMVTVRPSRQACDSIAPLARGAIALALPPPWAYAAGEAAGPVCSARLLDWPNDPIAMSEPSVGGV